MQKLAARVALTALSLAIVLVCRSADAQQLRVGGGLTLPLAPGEFTDLYDFGFHGGIELTGTVNQKKTTHLGLGAYHHRFLLDKDGVADSVGAPPDSVDISGGTYFVTEVFGLVRFELSDTKTRPHLLAGLGFAHQGITTLETRVGGVTRKTSFDGEVDPMGTVGVGLSHSLGKIGLFAQIRWTIIFEEDDDTMILPFTVGVVF